MSVRIEWRAVLAVYTGAFVIVAALSLVASQAHVPVLVLTLVYYAAVFALFWAVGFRSGLVGRTAVGCAVVGASLAWTLNTASRNLGLSLGTLGGGDIRASMLWISGVGLGVLIAVLAGWVWRDGRWKSLFGVVAIEIVATVGILIAVDRVLGDPAWLSSATILATSWDAALRLLAAWMLAIVIYSWGLRFAVGGAEGANGH